AVAGRGGAEPRPARRSDRGAPFSPRAGHAEAPGRGNRAVGSWARRWLSPEPSSGRADARACRARVRGPARTDRLCDSTRTRSVSSDRRPVTPACLGGSERRDDHDLGSHQLRRPCRSRPSRRKARVPTLEGATLRTPHTGGPPSVSPTTQITWPVVTASPTTTD